MILPDNPPTRDKRLSVLFDLSVPEQAEALHTFRAAFAGQTDLEAVADVVFVLHVLPGVCSCGEAAA